MSGLCAGTDDEVSGDGSFSHHTGVYKESNEVQINIPYLKLWLAKMGTAGLFSSLPADWTILRVTSPPHWTTASSEAFRCTRRTNVPDEGLVPADTKLSRAEVARQRAISYCAAQPHGHEESGRSSLEQLRAVRKYLSLLTPIHYFICFFLN